MKVVIVGRNRPFWGGSLRKIGETVDVPKELYDDEKKRSSWMGKPKRKAKQVAEPAPQSEPIPNVV